MIRRVVTDVLHALSRVSVSTSPAENLRKIREYRMTRMERFKYGAMAVIALFAVVVIQEPPFPFKLLPPALYALALLFPITSQFVLPATPIFLWLLLFYSARFIPPSTRPHIWVSVLPTLETILYGANISDILTRFGHPLLDILAWIPYGVVHFVAPFVVAAFIFVYAPIGSVQMFGQVFGFTNLLGVLIQIAFPCAPPWYELREGLTPANYGMRGSPAGLARIDALFKGHGYTLTFTGAPVVFGAFPSLHAACATCESLFLSYFFPGKVRIGRFLIDARVFYWGYSFWLYWCTMYLMHHYLIDLTAGGCLATMCFYLFRTEEVRTAMEQRVAAMEQTDTGATLPMERLATNSSKRTHPSDAPRSLHDEEHGGDTTAIFALDEEENVPAQRASFLAPPETHVVSQSARAAAGHALSRPASSTAQRP